MLQLPMSRHVTPGVGGSRACPVAQVVMKSQLSPSPAPPPPASTAPEPGPAPHVHGVHRVWKVGLPVMRPQQPCPVALAFRADVCACQQQGSEEGEPGPCLRP